MFWTRLAVSLAEFALSVLLSVFVVFWSYKSFARMTAYDAEEEIKKGNVAVALVLTALMVATSLMMHETVYPVTSILTVYLHGRGESGIGLVRLLAYCGGHLALGFFLAVWTIKLSLLLFNKLTGEMDETEEIRKGNVAVAIVLAGVVLVIALYLQQGVGGVTKTLIPQPSLGEVQVVR